MMRESEHGSDSYIIANDLDQAGDDLSLTKKLIRVNPDLQNELDIYATEIRRKDGRGILKVLPAQDAVGAHGKTSNFVGIDEAHGYKNWDLLEGLQPDPTRRDALMWITSYDVLVTAGTGTPLADLKALGMAGCDPRMLFSWYSGDFTTDPAFQDLTPEQRANPSMASWPEGPAYLEQQRRRLPTFKFRRLHLNLPGAASGAFLDPDAVTAAIVKGRRKLPRQPGVKYFGFVDMSGGSADDAALSIAHKVSDRVVVDVAMTQAGPAPFNPRTAIKLFAGTLREYGLSSVIGDAYAGLTFRQDFESHGISYRLSPLTTSELYEELEPRLNAREVELPENNKLEMQLLNLVVRGMKVGHPHGQHDDVACAVAGAIAACTARHTVDIRDCIGPLYGLGAESRYSLGRAVHAYQG